MERPLRSCQSQKWRNLQKCGYWWRSWCLWWQLKGWSFYFGFVSFRVLLNFFASGCRHELLSVLSCSKRWVDDLKTNAAQKPRWWSNSGAAAWNVGAEAHRSQFLRTANRCEGDFHPHRLICNVAIHTKTITRKHTQINTDVSSHTQRHLHIKRYIGAHMHNAHSSNIFPIIRLVQPLAQVTREFKQCSRTWVVNSR